jgi:8-oxo-dGTP pyrophosphatase MutT (NUDIX family)
MTNVNPTLQPAFVETKQVHMITTTTKVPTAATHNSCSNTDNASPSKVSETTTSSQGSYSPSSLGDIYNTPGQQYEAFTPPASILPIAVDESISSSWCFPLDLDLVQELQGHPVTRIVERESLSGDKKQSNGTDDHHYTISQLQTISREARGLLMELTVSREGRELQRWEHLGVVPVCTNNDSQYDTSSHSGQLNYGQPNCRLTTGCIPILPGGRVLLISSTKSQDVFVLPKGGWEQDESLPLSALRETLEEAGVTGLLGPPLPALTYETKKSVSRRLLLEESSPSTVHSSTRVSTTIVTSESPVSNYHTHNRLVIFPLYVQCIYERWPEENRVRRIVTMDEAAILLQHRPEFLHMLQVLRNRGLHHLSG